MIIRQPTRLYLGPRYLNIQKLILEADGGLFTLKSSTGRLR